MNTEFTRKSARTFANINFSQFYHSISRHFVLHKHPRNREGQWRGLRILLRADEIWRSACFSVGISPYISRLNASTITLISALSFGKQPLSLLPYSAGVSHAMGGVPLRRPQQSIPAYTDAALSTPPSRNNALFHRPWSRIFNQYTHFKSPSDDGG